MKKLLLAVVGLVVIAVVLVVLLHRPETTPAAVTLLPDSTIALVDIPDFQSCRAKVAASPVARFCQEPEVRAALPLDRAGVGRLLAEDEVEEGGFARAVGADEAETVRARDKQRHVAEEFAGAVGLGNIGDSEHGNRPPHPTRTPASMRSLVFVQDPAGRSQSGASKCYPSSLCASLAGRVGGLAGRVEGLVPNRRVEGASVLGQGDLLGEDAVAAR